MILVDTSVWIAHFRARRTSLATCLQKGQVLSHPFVIGELACGRLINREEILVLSGALPQAVSASQDEVLLFLESHGLAGSGLGFIDVHLLASARLSEAPLWTLDESLRRAAQRLGVSFEPK